MSQDGRGTQVLTCQAHQQVCQSLQAHSSSHSQHSPALASFQVQCRGSSPWTATELGNPALRDMMETSQAKLVPISKTAPCIPSHEINQTCMTLKHILEMRAVIRGTFEYSRAGRLRSRMNREWVRRILPVIGGGVGSVRFKPYIDHWPWEVVLFDQLPGVSQSLYIVQSIHMYSVYLYAQFDIVICIQIHTHTWTYKHKQMLLIYITGSLLSCTLHTIHFPFVLT